MTPQEREREISDLIGSCYHDPLKHVMISYPWKTDPSIQMVELAPKYRERFPSCVYGPDEWACEFLDDVGMESRARGFDGKNAVPPMRYSTVSGHGIGKSALSAFIIRWIMDTRPLSKGTVTATTDTQLRTKTWAELGKWHNRGLTAHWFDYQSSRGNMAYRSTKFLNNDPAKPLAGEWFCTAQTCKEENSEAFAGQHAPNGSSFYLFDEASGIPGKIFEVREGGLSDGHPMIFDFGNGTKNTGEFFENCVGKMKHRYKVRSIDSRSVKITNKALLDQWIADYGIDSDFVKVRIRGMFPSQASTQFIPTEMVVAAMMRTAALNRYAKLIIGVDVARFGDDSSVIYPRIGDDACTFPFKMLNQMDTVAITTAVIAMCKEFAALGLRVSAIMVDGTGGSIGGAVGDQLRALGWPAIDVGFGKTSPDPKYRYMGDYMWGKLRDALPRLVLPRRTADAHSPGQLLYEQLTQRLFGYMTGTQKIHLEPKAEMKLRGIGSPDIADALALTYAHELATMADVSMPGLAGNAPMTVVSDYDPLRSKD